MEWTNNRPTKDGYYWVVEKYFHGEELIKTTKPDIWYIDPNSEYGCCAQLGTDDPREIPPTEDMIIEHTGGKRVEYWVKPIPEVFFDEKYHIDTYPETHQEGILSIEKDISTGMHHCDLGIQIAPDGRIWLCVNGEAYIRFKPMSEEMFNTLKSINKKE